MYNISNTARCQISWESCVRFTI